MKDRVTISRRHAFSVVPDAILEHEELSHASVRAIAWALGRPEGWDLRIGYWCLKCGLTDKTWPKVKKEITDAGYFRQWKTRDARGRIEWHQEITDAPIYTTPPKRRDGAGMDGSGRDAGGGDKAAEVNQEDVNKKQLLPLQQPAHVHQSVGSSSDLQLPEKIGEDVRTALLKLVDGLDHETAQAVIDEAIGIHDAGAVRVSLPSLTAGLIRKVKEGEFQPAAGVAVRQARRRAAERQAQLPAPDQPKASPDAARRHLAAIKTALGLKKEGGPSLPI